MDRNRVDSKKAISTKFFLRARVLLIVLLLVILVAPYVINELYKLQSGYLTLWEAKDTLQYVISACGVIGTTALGCVALYANEKMAAINEKMAVVNEEMSVITQRSLLREQRSEIALLDCVKVDENEPHRFKFEFLLVGDDRIRIRIWMYNPLHHSIRKAKINDAKISLINQSDMMGGKPEKNNCLEFIKEDSNSFSILPKQERIFALYFPYSKSFQVNNRFHFHVVFENENNFGQRLLETLDITFRGRLNEQLVLDEPWTCKLYSEEVHYEWID